MTSISTTTDLVTPARVLAIGAHPDDIEFGCGATLAKWARAGATVHLCVLTDGSKGTWDPNRDIAELVRIRAGEQQTAADRLGAAHVHMLGRIDGELDSDLATRADLCRVIRQARPDVVLGHDPWKRYRLHPDHRHAGQLTIDAIVAARDPHFFADQELAPHRPESLLLFEAEVIDHVERVHDVDVDARVASLLAHESQWESTMHIAADPAAERTRFEAAQRHECAQAGHRVGAVLGEAFKRIDDL